MVGRGRGAYCEPATVKVQTVRVEGTLIWCALND
jgi:hypothetical protein